MCKQQTTTNSEYGPWNRAYTGPGRKTNMGLIYCCYLREWVIHILYFHNNSQFVVVLESQVEFRLDLETAETSLANHRQWASTGSICGFGFCHFVYFCIYTHWSSTVTHSHTEFNNGMWSLPNNPRHDYSLLSKPASIGHHNQHHKQVTAYEKSPSRGCWVNLNRLNP